MKAFILALAIILPGGLPLVAAKPGDEVTQMLRAFYQWYVPRAEQSDPKDDPRMKDYVTNRLLDQIAGLSKSEEGEVAELDYDPFLNAQDVLTDWRSHIAVRDVKVKGDTATATVVLGAKEPSKVRLQLVRQDGKWKIDNFTPPLAD
jgi:hypothetical protein